MKSFLNYNKMYIPSQEQWQKVIDTLKSVLPMAASSDNFDMGYGIQQDNACGTVCCVAGWYTMALAKPEEIGFLLDNHWLHGKEAIGRDLGFSDGDEFKLWADKNRKLWGNHDGWNMFIVAEAYNSGVDGAYANTLEDVINHYEFVKKQCDAYTNKSTMANGN